MRKIKEDVLTTGYWLVTCIDIQSAWDHCLPENVDKNTIVPEVHSCPDLEVSSDNENPESILEKNIRCHKEQSENFCRNHMLNYFAQLRYAQDVYIALLWQRDFRTELHEKCSLTMHSLSAYPFFNVRLDDQVDELFEALAGRKDV